MDVKFVGGNWQCDWGDGICEEMEKEIDFVLKDSFERSNDFKYVFDVSCFFVILSVSICVYLCVDYLLD